MNANKKINLQKIRIYALTLIACITLLGMIYKTASYTLTERIDKQIDKKTKYIIILLQQIATEEQKKCADEEYKRWENTN